MIYFIDIDEAGNILQACGDPNITITPVIPRVSYQDRSKPKNQDGQYFPRTDPEGNLVSFFGSKLMDPIRITKEEFELIVPSLQNYKYDHSTRQITRR